MAFVVVTTDNVCRICRIARTDCTCIASCKRIRNNDPIHPRLLVASEFIEETRYFGNTALEDALAMIQSERQAALVDRVAGVIDGFEYMRVDKDAHRLAERAKGKLYGTVLKLKERDTTPSRSPRSQSNADVIAQFKRINRVQVA